MSRGRAGPLARIATLTAVARTATVAAVAAIAAIAVSVPEAHADEVKLPKTRAVLDVPRGWAPIEGVADRGLVAAYRGERGVILAVTRAQVPNTDAYRARAREAYVEQIERGIAASVPGYRRVSRRFGEQRGTPALDLEARRADGATIVVRVLLFWTYALSVAIEVPRGGDVKAARAVAASFAPAPPTPTPAP